MPLLIFTVMMFHYLKSCYILQDQMLWRRA